MHVPLFSIEFLIHLDLKYFKMKFWKSFHNLTSHSWFNGNITKVLPFLFLIQQILYLSQKCMIYYSVHLFAQIHNFFAIWIYMRCILLEYYSRINKSRTSFGFALRNHFLSIQHLRINVATHGCLVWNIHQYLHKQPEAQWIYI